MPETDTSYQPSLLEDIDKNLWSETLPGPALLARLWNKYMPRGKGWFPRLVGRLYGKSLDGYCIRTKHGAYLAIEPSSLDTYVHMLNHNRTWNEPVFETCKDFLTAGCVFYDIGANIGYISLEMAKVFQDKVLVIAFEPQPLLAHIIALSSKLNGFENVKVFELMIGEGQGETNLYVGSHSIHASAVAREESSKRIKRQTRTIDEMVGSGSIPPPTVIKMDIEGGELSALSGAKKTIASYRPHLIFESDENMVRFRYSRKDILDLITSLASYDFFFIGGENNKPLKLDEANRSLSYSDILAVPNTSQNA